MSVITEEVARKMSDSAIARALSFARNLGMTIKDPQYKSFFATEEAILLAEQDWRRFLSADHTDAARGGVNFLGEEGPFLNSEGSPGVSPPKRPQLIAYLIACCRVGGA